MSQDDDRQSSPGNEEARRKRAADLHEQIEQRKSGTPPDEPDRPRRRSPREFTEQSVRDETEHEQPPGED